MVEYIEREAALEEIRKLRKLALLTQVDYYNAGVEDAYKAVKAVPVADVPSVCHGKWIEPHWKNNSHCAICSKCGAEAQHSEYRGVFKYYKFCPNCWAIMDGEQKNG